jgi:hypothetical protein
VTGAHMDKTTFTFHLPVRTAQKMRYICSVTHYFHISHCKAEKGCLFPWLSVFKLTVPVGFVQDLSSLLLLQLCLARVLGTFIHN